MVLNQKNLYVKSNPKNPKKDIPEKGYVTQNIIILVQGDVMSCICGANIYLFLSPGRAERDIDCIFNFPTILWPRGEIESAD
jgi:hypothetical protein